MKSPIKILYVSSLCSKSLLSFIFNSGNEKPGQAEQKFHRLLTEGLVKQKWNVQVEALSALPVSSKSHKELVWNVPKELNGNITFRYIPFINLPILRNFLIVVFSFFKIIFWNWENRRQEKLVICDPLKLSITGTAILASKIIRTKTIAIVTDFPDLMVGDSSKKNLKFSLYSKIISFFISSFNGYVFLTEQMSTVVNLHRRPYIIMEGLVDIEMKSLKNQIEKKNKNRVLIYAGGIYEKYGVKKLIDAFISLEGDDLRLHIFGQGEMEKDMNFFMGRDSRISYKGVVPNQEVVEKQLEATLLINPRPSSEEFTKYSFPSKNMEYMVSGTPLVTTPLPGMPKEYNDFVYLFEDESVEGISSKLKNILDKPKEELHLFGERAKEFVLNNKNNKIQAERLLRSFS